MPKIGSLLRCTRRDDRTTPNNALAWLTLLQSHCYLKNWTQSSKSHSQGAAHKHVWQPPACCLARWCTQVLFPLTFFQNSWTLALSSSLHPRFMLNNKVAI